MPRRLWIGAISLLLTLSACSRSGPVDAVPPTRTTPSEQANKYGWYNLGVAAQVAHEREKATSDFVKALTIDPKFEAALYQYGLLLYDAADYPAAITYLRRATVENPIDANALWTLGLAWREVHTKTGDVEASRFLRAALAIDPALVKTLPQGSGSGG